MKDMKRQLFSNVARSKDSDWIIKEFFNAIYSQDRFLWALPLLINKGGCVVNDDYCLFPDFSDNDPSSHFEGVMFGVGDDEIIVSDETYSVSVSEACKKYLELHPSDEPKVSEILGSK